MHVAILATIYGRTTHTDGSWYENRRWDVIEIGGDEPHWEVRASERNAPDQLWGEMSRKCFHGTPAAEAMAEALDQAGWLVGVTEAGVPEVGDFYAGG